MPEQGGPLNMGWWSCYGRKEYTMVLKNFTRCENTLLRLKLLSYIPCLIQIHIIAWNKRSLSLPIVNRRGSPKGLSGVLYNYYRIKQSMLKCKNTGARYKILIKRQPAGNTTVSL